MHITLKVKIYSPFTSTPPPFTIVITTNYKSTSCSKSLPKGRLLTKAWNNSSTTVRVAPECIKPLISQCCRSPPWRSKWHWHKKYKITHFTIASQFMVGKYTISAHCTLFTQVVHVPNTFKVLQGIDAVRCENSDTPDPIPTLNRVYSNWALDFPIGRVSIAYTTRLGVAGYILNHSPIGLIPLSPPARPTRI